MAAFVRDRGEIGSGREGQDEIVKVLPERKRRVGDIAILIEQLSLMPFDVGSNYGVVVLPLSLLPS